MFDLKKFQEEQRIWSTKNFGETYGSGYRSILGAVEELGELAHAHLKSEQGIRTDEDHTLAKKDAVGDIVIYLADYCWREGLSLEDCISDAWEIVSKRDWSNKKNGNKIDE